jgi:flagellin-like protein
MNKSKKGVSPIIATVLLIVLVIIIAIIILLWSQLFFKEKILKFDKLIENACTEVSLRTFVNEDDSFGFTNTGNVPIYRFDLRLSSKGTSVVSSVNKPVDSGFSSIAEGYNYDSYEKVEIIPVLLGETDKGGPKEFICSKNVFVV